MQRLPCAAWACSDGASFAGVTVGLLAGQQASQAGQRTLFGLQAELCGSTCTATCWLQAACWLAGLLLDGAHLRLTRLAVMHVDGLHQQ